MDVADLIHKSAKPAHAGTPAWVVTFADLMTLLMCFFVLLLAFSEMDVQKYKQVAGSMKQAFGVQRDIRAQETPKGTSVIAQEFSPGKPQPTDENVVRQQTSDETKSDLVFTDARVQQAEDLARHVRDALVEQVQAEQIDVESEDGKVIIRIREKGSFPSGSDELQPGFLPILARIALTLRGSTGEIRVAGHTDDQPIRTERFRSNWDLATARAVSVVHLLIQAATIDPRRITAEGHADAHPLVPNDTPEHRARNRRVEIVVLPVVATTGTATVIEPATGGEGRE